MRRYCVAFIVLAVACGVLAQTRPTSQPSDLAAEVEQLRHDNEMLKQLLENTVRMASGKEPVVSKDKYDALEKERDMLMERFGEAEAEVRRLREEIRGLKAQQKDQGQAPAQH